MGKKKLGGVVILCNFETKQMQEIRVGGKWLHGDITEKQSHPMVFYEGMYVALSLRGDLLYDL